MSKDKNIENFENENTENANENIDNDKNDTNDTENVQSTNNNDTENTQTSEESNKNESQSDDETSNDELANKIEEALKAANDKYLRLMAEYDNYRKRTIKEKSDIYNDATVNCISEILPVIDNFERALETECSDEKYKSGVEMIFTQFKNILEKLGVKEIETLNQQFDPNLHHAIKNVENDELEENTICEVFQKGYILGEKVIRHAMVSVVS